MVMEREMETPSPQCIGQEFVRQYYTILHQVPEQLHRFYSHDSCFVHGGMDKPDAAIQHVCGQHEINSKIMDLNFVDCYVKIAQVDSQPTIGNAVVVQVAGELSNNGQAMRRFMQTFVLVSQSPKKYYVHNDIFRYQDEVFVDADSDTENTEDVAEVVGVAEDEAALHDAGPPPAAHYHDYAPPVTNGQALHEEEAGPGAQPLTPEPTPEPEEEEQVEEEEEEEVLEEPMEEPEEVYEPEPLPEPEPPKAAPPANMTWAAMLQSGSSPAPSAAPPPKPHPPPIKAAPPQDYPRDQRVPRNDSYDRQARGPPPPRDGSRQSEGGGRPDDMRQNQIRYPDAQQLFVGSLPPQMTQEDLKDFLDQFGRVVDTRIMRRPGTNLNYSFVVFEDEKTAQDVLAQRPFTLSDGHRINVEEKKQPMGGPRTGERGRGGRGAGPGMMGGRGGGMPGERPWQSQGRGGPDGGRGGPQRRGGYGGPPRR